VVAVDLGARGAGGLPDLGALVRARGVAARALLAGVEAEELREAESQLSAMAAAGLVQMPRGADRAAAHEEPEQRRRAALEEVEKFIRENPRLDERSVDVFRRQDPDIQAAAMDRGTLKDCANPSAALSARIRDAKQERWNPEASTGPKASKEVEAFIRENKVQVGAAKLLRECPPEVQRRVLLRGGLSSFRNPSAMLTTTIKDCKEILQAQKERGLNMDEQNEQQSTKTNESLQLDREHLRRTVEALKAGRHKIFTDHLPGGQGKGGGKGDAAPAATAAMPPPDVPVKTDGAKPRPVAARWARKATVKTEADACKPGDAEAALAEPVKPAVPLPSKEGSTKPVAKLEDDGLTEIERRRRGMAAAQSEIERRRRAEEEAAEEAAEEAGGEEGPDPKRPRAGDGAAAPQSAAMQQGLQGWAERVNMLSIEEPGLAKACREFVRKRILRAHAEGNLHSVDWSEEAIPTPEQLEEMFPQEDDD